MLSWPHHVTCHYLNQWWLNVNWMQRKKILWNISQYTNNVLHGNAFGYFICKMLTILSRCQCAKGPSDLICLCWSYRARWWRTYPVVVGASSSRSVSGVARASLIVHLCKYASVQIQGPALLTLKSFYLKAFSRKYGCDWLMLKHQPITGF